MTITVQPAKCRVRAIKAEDAFKPANLGNATLDQAVGPTGSG